MLINVINKNLNVNYAYYMKTLCKVCKKNIASYRTDRCYPKLFIYIIVSQVVAFFTSNKVTSYSVL